jgi:hypothetical protein
MRRHELDPVSGVFGFAFTALGLLFLLGQADQALRLRWIWPLLLLVLGVAILFDIARGRGRTDPTPDVPDPTEPAPTWAESDPTPAPGDPDPDRAATDLDPAEPDPGPDPADLEPTPADLEPAPAEPDPDPDPEAHRAVDNREHPI